MPATDVLIFRAVNGLAGRWLVLDAFGMYCASVLIVLIVIIAAIPVLRAVGHSHYFEALALSRPFVAASLAWLLNQGIGLLAARVRPYLALQGTRLMINAPWTAKSFPSDHAAMAFALAAALGFRSRTLGYWCLAMAALVAAGRVFVGVHYPSDVAAGAVIGVACARILAYRPRSPYAGPSKPPGA